MDFLTEDRSTEVSVRLAADGSVIGKPEVSRSSGLPQWDDNTIRAILRASPLPPPPEPGVWTFRFSPREDS